MCITCVPGTQPGKGVRSPGTAVAGFQVTWQDCMEPNPGLLKEQRVEPFLQPTFPKVLKSLYYCLSETILSEYTKGAASIPRYFCYNAIKSLA